MLAYSSIANAGYMLVGVAAASVSARGPEAAASVLYYLVVYAFANIGAFAAAAWLVRDKKTDDIDDLNGLGYQSPLLAVCIVILMLSLIGIPPLAGFFGKLYMFMEALNQEHAGTRLALIGLVALGLFNSVVSAFYYVRMLKAMFLREPSGQRLGRADWAIEIPIAVGTLVVIVFGLFPGRLMSVMQSASVPLLMNSSARSAIDDLSTQRHESHLVARGPRVPHAGRQSRKTGLAGGRGQEIVPRNDDAANGPARFSSAGSGRQSRRDPREPGGGCCEERRIDRRQDFLNRTSTRGGWQVARRLDIKADVRDDTVMAIINTFEKCLESPYLVQDKDAAGRIGGLLAKAGDRLEGAVNIQTSGQGDPADVVFLSYEAMFCCLRALVYSKGYREYGLRCLLLACENLYVRTGQFDADHLRKFELAQRLKLSPADAVAAASAFVKRTLELLGQ